jgi:hypothetical protein
MMRSTRRLLVAATCALLLLTGLEVAAEASSGTRAGAAVQAHRSGVACPAGRKTRLARPRLAAVSVPGGVQFAWGCTRGAKRYRVAWAAAPYGKWPGKRSYVSGWLPKSARSSTFAVSAVPHSGDFMLGVQYANPVYGQLDVKNARGRVRHSTGWVPVFPTPPDPGPGDALRVGTYNVLGGPNSASAPARIAAIAANIGSHGLQIVTLQEADDRTASSVVTALGGDWQYVRYTSSSQQILYRSGAYALQAQGIFNVSNPLVPSQPVTTPWARFVPAQASAASQPVMIVSSHVMENPNRSVMDRKHDAGVIASQIMAGVDAANGGGAPVVVAGDLHYLREPWGDVPGYVEAPPTMVRAGYYDAMAAVSKFNIVYSTYNGGNGMTAPAQQFFKSGVAPRADYIMLKGFRGSSAYVNVPNWSWNGVTPSDHNLVYADVVVPFR